jgi:FKBP-type peptidyl-prolyl cis-trans isomerase FkpA
MIKRILTIAILGAAIISNTGCKSNSGFKTINGISYKIIKDVPGKTAKMGDIIEFNFSVKVDTLPGKALVIIDTRKGDGQPKVARVDSVKQRGDFQAVFPLLSIGDSAVVQVSCDTILKTVPPAQMGHLPTWLKKGNTVNITIAVVSIKSMEEYQAEMKAKQADMQNEMKAKAAAQMPIDDKLLQDYFAKNNIKAQKTASGLYYTIQKPGSGPQITEGQVVSMMYTGKTLDGKAFDSNIDTSIGHHGNKPLVFPVGKHQMIAGVDEGVALLKKGSKATFYLPSPLGYGENAPPNIGPNAVLIFDVDITDVKAGGKNEPMQGEPQQQ